MSRPSQSTVEAILSQIDGITTSQSKSFELWIPRHLTLRGQVVRDNEAMTVILDKIYKMGYQPDGFTQETGGAICRYIPVDRGGYLNVGYYDELQKRLFDVFLYVSCDNRNFGTFSITLVSVFLDAASFFDSLAQTFIRSHVVAGNQFKAESKIDDFRRKIDGNSFFTMDDYRRLLEAEFLFSDKVLNLNTHGDDFYSPPTACFRDPARCFDVKPFAAWSLDKNPEWWRAFTRVKHDRIQHMEQATLGNTIEAYGAVLVVLTFLHQKFMKSHTRALDTYRLFTPRYWKHRAQATVMHPIFE
jgi:hypothetical protein